MGESPGHSSRLGARETHREAQSQDAETTGKEAATMKKLLGVGAFLAILAAMLVPATSAPALWPDPCGAYFADQTGWQSTNPTTADAIKTKIWVEPPANLSWPNGYCSGDNTINNNSLAFPMLFSRNLPGRSADEISYAQSNAQWSIDQAQPYIVTQWGFQCPPNYPPSCYHSVVHADLHPPIGSVGAWTYAVELQDSGLYWMNVYDGNGTRIVHDGTYLTAASVPERRVTYLGEVGHPATGFMGASCCNATTMFQQAIYHTPAFGGVWTYLNAADLSSVDAAHPHGTFGFNHGIWNCGGGSSTDQCFNIWER